MQLAAPPDVSFVAPSGRVLLPFDAAGQPLLGQPSPWTGQWQQQQPIPGGSQQPLQMELYPGSAARLQYSIAASRQLLMGLLHPSRSLNYTVTTVGQPQHAPAQLEPQIPYFDWNSKASVLPAVRSGRYGAPPGRSGSGGGLGSGRVLPVGGGPPPLTSADAAVEG